MQRSNKRRMTDQDKGKRTGGLSYWELLTISHQNEGLNLIPDDDAQKMKALSKKQQTTISFQLSSDSVVLEEPCGQFVSRKTLVVQHFSRRCRYLGFATISINKLLNSGNYDEGMKLVAKNAHIVNDDRMKRVKF